MAIPIIGGILGEIFGGVKDVISEVVVDKDKRIEMNYKLAELEDKAAARLNEQMLAQIEVNKTEAQHASVFVAGWRPAVGWIGAASLAYSFMINPFMEFGARMWGYDGAFPELPMEYIMTIMAGMLGFGGLRTYEKARGVESTEIKKTSESTTKIETTGGANTEVSVTHDAEPVKKKSKSIFKKIGKLI